MQITLGFYWVYQNMKYHYYQRVSPSSVGLSVAAAAAAAVLNLSVYVEVYVAVIDNGVCD